MKPLHVARLAAEAYNHVGNMWLAAQQETTGEISLRAAALCPLSMVENGGFGIVSARPIGMAGDNVSHSQLPLFT